MWFIISAVNVDSTGLSSGSWSNLLGTNITGTGQDVSLTNTNVTISAPSSVLRTPSPPMGQKDGLRGFRLERRRNQFIWWTFFETEFNLPASRA